MLARTRDLDELHGRLSPWLRAKYAGAEEVVVSPFKKPSAGISNETLVFSVKLRVRGVGGEDRLVARLMPAGSPVFPEYDLRKQFRILECLGSSAVPVPRALWFEADPAVIGCPFYVMRAVEGSIPSEIPPYHAFGFCLELSPAERARLWWSGIETLNQIHSLDWRRLEMTFLGAPPAPQAAVATATVDSQVEYYERYLQWARGEKPQPILEAALEWLQRHRYTPRRVSLCWGDSRLPNMIFQEQEVAAVLDWEMAFLGDPEADLAWWLFLDWCSSTGYGIPRLEGLPSEEETVARYEQLSGQPVEHLQYQKIMAAFRYGVITVRVARLMLEAKLPIANEEMETNNVCTQWLAEELNLPPPGAARAVTHLEQVRASVQFHLTGAGPASWYIVVAGGSGSRHDGTVDSPDVTMIVDADDWRAMQSGELNRTQAFLGGKLRIEGDITLLLQLEDIISRLNQ